MVVDEGLLRRARECSTRWVEVQRQAERSKAEYHHAVRRLHFAGASMREVAEALDLSHQRVHQIIDTVGGSRSWRLGKKSSQPAACSFCGLAPPQVDHLIAGPSIAICRDCITAARQISVGDVPAHSTQTDLDFVPAAIRLACSFCRKPRSKTRFLIAGPGVCVCDECLRICEQISEEMVSEEID